jgi:UDP-N-acetylmuramate dehydrogenase
MNAGGHGAETAQCLVSARVADLASGSDRLLTPAELGLSYRHSNLSPADLVLSACFTVGEEPRARLESEIEEIVRWRRAHQPGGRNAGSVFSNPPGDAAGRLLEEAGAKGLRVGSAQVSLKHANFIGVDEGGAAADVLAVIEAARALVLERFGIELTLEVRLVGFGR